MTAPSSVASREALRCRSAGAARKPWVPGTRVWTRGCCAFPRCRAPARAQPPIPLVV
jgi:hypothetical protein